MAERHSYIMWPYRFPATCCPEISHALPGLALDECSEEAGNRSSQQVTGYTAYLQVPLHNQGVVCSKRAYIDAVRKLHPPCLLAHATAEVNASEPGSIPGWPGMSSCNAVRYCCSSNEDVVMTNPHRDTTGSA